jgi:hypothetical protein
MRNVEDRTTGEEGNNSKVGNKEKDNARKQVQAATTQDQLDHIRSEAHSSSAAKEDKGGTSGVSKTAARCTQKTMDNLCDAAEPTHAF